MASNKRECFSLELKSEIINEVDMKRKTKVQICRDYNILSETLYTFLRNKGAIMSAISTGQFKPDRKRLKTTGHEKLDRCLLVWFNQAPACNTPISGPMLFEKGKELAKELDLTDFQMSRGWVDRFKDRHGIGLKVISGEAASAPTETTVEWRGKELQEILKEYNEEDIFNADETGLFYKCLPNKTLVIKGDTCTGQKIPKDRISIIVAANMDGSQKLPLLVIGKFDFRPRCMKNIRILPVTYKANKKAGMTGSVFEEWLRKLDRKFLLEGRSIALIVDNCSAHPRLDGLRAIKLVFLPLNATSVLQPCDQGIIQNLKCHYRKRVLRRFIKVLDENGSGDSHYKLTVLHAINYVAAAWDEVKQTTIANCFRKVVFTKKEEVDNDNSDNGSIEDLEVANLFDQAAKALGVFQTLQEYVGIDNEIPATEHLSLQKIAALESGPMPTSTFEEREEEEDAEQAIVSNTEVENALSTLPLYLQQHVNIMEKLGLLDNMERRLGGIVSASKKQSSTKSFFKPVVKINQQM